MNSIHCETLSLPERGLLVVPVQPGQMPDFGSGALAPLASIKPEEYARESGFSGEYGELLDISLPPDLGPARLLLVGTGGLDALSPRQLMELGGKISSEASRLEINEVCLLETEALFDGATSRTACCLLTGIGLKSYRFDRYRTSTKSDKKPLEITYLTERFGDENLQRELDICNRDIDAVFLARDLTNTPPNDMTPVDLCAAALKLEPLGVKVSVLNEDDLAAQRFPGVLAVGRGSSEPSCVAIMEWHGPNGDKKPEIGLAGKGVTFDSGGLTLKTEAQQRTMKSDMGGAASVIGTMHTIASQGLDVGVVGIIGAVENLPGPNAFRSGDVLSMRNGTSVEISFPDAEGRIVLADLLDYLNEHYSLKSMVDVATLTYTVVAALGQSYTGLFSNDAGLSQKLLDASTSAGEQMWRLPVDPSYLTSIKSNIADMKNMPDTGGSIAPGSASIAAAFIEHFAGATPWAHLDTGGSEWSGSEHSLGQSGAQGSAVLALSEWLRAEV